MRGGIETNSRKLIALLKADGWVPAPPGPSSLKSVPRTDFRAFISVGTTGDHWHFKHPTKPGRVTVPHPVKDLRKGTVLSIHRQAGWR